jgi:hypothetical protein
VLRILLLLTATAGLPYILVSSTSPILQALYARNKPGASPWRLFALSNTGSLLGLLSYPVLIEPRLALDGQALWWSGLYVCYAVGTVFALVPGPPAVQEVTFAIGVPEKNRPLAWIGLPALASVMLLAGTNYLTTNVPPTPFLWILPLTAYLLSFILTFDSDRWYRPRVFTWLLAAALLGMALCVRRAEVTFEVRVLAPAITLGVFVISMWCHGELVRLRPGPALLTRFYLMIAAGGAVGGLLVSVIAPAALPGSAEFPVGLALVAVTALAMNYGKNILRDAAQALVAAVVISVGLAYLQEFVGKSVTTARSFYGALRVTDTREDNALVRTLVHGLIGHGTQVREPATDRMKATSYYAQGSGVWQALDRTQKPSGRRVGIVGLGAGTLAAWGLPGDTMRFYEINPDVIRLASEYFTYLKDSPARNEVIAGDGRLVLEREAPQNFDVLVVDAFTGDTVPTHLLTREALAIYTGHLSQGGILAMHISNTALDIEPVVEGIARGSGFHTAIFEVQPDKQLRRANSKWALLSRNPAFLQGGRPIRAIPGMRPWTDDYNSVWPILR